MHGDINADIDDKRLGVRHRTSGPPPDGRVGGIAPPVGVPRIFFGAFAWTTFWLDTT